MSCKDLFTEVDEINEYVRLIIEGGSCFNPELALVQNTKVYHDYWKMVAIKIDEALESKVIYMFYSYTIFDSEDPERPIKKSIKPIKLSKGVGVLYELILHKVEL